MGIWSDLFGTSNSFFRLGLSGVRLKNSAGNLAVRNAADSADAEITASRLLNTGNDVLIGTTNVLTVSKNATQAGALQIIYPAAKATDGQVLAQKAGTAAGIIEFELVSAGSTASSDKLDTTALAFNSSITVAMFSTSALDVLEYFEVVIDTAFNGTAPSMSIGIAGTVSKYVASTEVDLAAVAKTKFYIHSGLPAQGIEALIITFTAGGGATAGAARVIAHYAQPV